MKIIITKTVLTAMTDVAWSMFCRFMTDSGVDYTPIQEPAALYMRYYFAVYNEGHAGFFECYEGTDIGSFIQALTAIGAPEFADNLIDAAKNGSQDNYEKADAWFDQNSNTLLAAIQSYLKSNIDEFYEIVDEDYTMLPNKLTFWLSTFIAAIVLVSMAIIALTQTIVYYSLFFLMFLTIASPFLALIVYSIFWRVSVKKDVITIRRPFRKKRIIRIDEISDVRVLRDKLMIYAHGKKAVTVKKEVSEYWLFITQLDVEGKIVSAQPSNFFIKQPISNIVNGLMWPFSAVVFLIWDVTRKINPPGIYEISFFTVLVVIALWYFLWCLPLRITILENILTIKNVLGHEKEYQFSDITKVMVGDQTTTIFINNKKLVEIASASEGYSTLLQKLRNENIPVYRKGNASDTIKKKKVLKKKVPIEEQLSVLSDLGIKPIHKNFEEWVCAEFGKETIEFDPYNLLLYSLGGDRELEDGRWEPLSDDIYNFDTECVEDDDIYATIFMRLAVISKGQFDISDVSSKVNHIRERASISFSLDEKKYSWQLHYYGDWFDTEIIGRINHLLKCKGSLKFFYVSSPDQSITVIFETDEIINKLNGLVSTPFGLHISEGEQ